MAESSIGRRRKAALRALGAVAAAIVIAACSSSASSTASSPAAASAAATASAASPASGSSTAAATGSPITVGIICDCTGAFAGVLTDGAKVYQAWANTVNAAGGINGHPVKIDLVDDQSNPGNSLTDVENLVNQDHVAALLDETDLDETWASFAKAHNVPVIGANITEAPFYTNSDFYAEGAT
jgi:branched-chain amino acid transport system substrate-binding protein